MAVVAVLGTGTMGAGMARNLLGAGHEVRAWNRTAEKAQPLAADGAVVVDDPAAAVEGADVVVTMLFDLDATRSVVERAAPALGSSAVWIQTGTVGLDGTDQLGRLAADLGVGMLDSPVLGTKKPAEDGTLVVLASGDPALRAAAEPVWAAVASRTVWAGDRLGAATALKLACNAWVTTITGATAQSLALAAALGLDPSLFLQAIAGGPTDSAYAQLKGGTMLAGQYPASFELDGALKDLELIVAAAEGAAVQPGIAAAVRDLFRTAQSRGHGDEDFAVVYEVMRER